ncbi:MAG: PspC domain-containing protein [Clostridiales bacterium]|nr:PspC domain-containing protein [Clostridiales bacterium]MCF8022979.1 PspC domain-containing protein [Clostridiales bacterium]
MARQIKRFARSSHNCMLGGVCGGIGEYFGISPAVIRLSYILISIFSAAFPGILVYIIAWLIIPKKV